MRTLAIATVLSITAASTAALDNPDIPTWRGDANTAFAQWDSFTSANGNANVAEQGEGWNLYNFGSGAVISSSGNIYASGGELNIHVYPAVMPLFAVQQAVVNISFAGNPIDTDNVRALLVDQESGSFVNSSTAELVGGGTGGPFAPVTWAFTFDLSALGQGFQGLSFFFGSELTNSSLDAISIDVLGSAIPGPGALALLGVAGIGARRRRR